MTKKILFWNYPRTSWQWDILCVVILIFIFLTPKTWFASTGYQKTHTKHTIMVDVLNGKPDKTEAERRAMQMVSGSGGTVSDIREVSDAAGNLIRYEVDIR